jgi:branched-chain amino acid transport system substrate-binding protein
MFEGITGLDVATQNLNGAVTPASIIAAAKAMPWSVLPGAGGYHVRCNGKADPAVPATCTAATLLATLGANGKATKYVVVGDAQIPA